MTYLVLGDQLPKVVCLLMFRAGTVAFRLEGPKAHGRLNAFCALDLVHNPYGLRHANEPVRKVEIVLWRIDARLFHIIQGSRDLSRHKCPGDF